MRFELTVAFKYLIPKWRQLSVSIISLISVLVISLVVWLVVLFLSVTEGMEKKWIEELVALNAPVRMTPTEAYYNSYYYQIDSVSLDSNYTTKTLGEKGLSLQTDPYDHRVDMELSYNFPSPDRYEDGRLKDLVKEGYDAIHSLPFSGVRLQEYEVAFGNLRLHVLRKGTNPHEVQQTYITQVSYISGHDGENRRVNRMILPPTAEDYNNLLESLSQTGTAPTEDTEEYESVDGAPLAEKLKKFFADLEISELKTNKEGFPLSPVLFPKQGKLKGIGLVRYHQIMKVMIPQATSQLPSLKERLDAFGYQTTQVELLFDDTQMHVVSEESFPAMQEVQIVLDEDISFQAALIESSLDGSDSLEKITFQIAGKIQHVPITGTAPFEHVHISQAKPKQSVASESPQDCFWVTTAVGHGCHIPTTSTLQEGFQAMGEGLLVAKHFKNNGVRLGDRGHLSYYAAAGSSMQEQRIPIYVAGFYDPGMMPIGNKLIFVDPSIVALLRGNTAVADPMLGNGINIWIDHLEDAAQVKEELIKSLEVRDIAQYWNVQSYHDYEFTRPILEQIQSDKHLFTLIALIILIVACSNIISMLILLVNDKKKEIGILQSMGASPQRIALIFGFCGFAMGLTSCVIGVAVAVLTLQNLQSLVDLLSFMQGRDAFQAVFYGSTLPNDVSYSALIFVIGATLFISLLAGMIPAIKAARIRPTEILRSE